MNRWLGITRLSALLCAVAVGAMMKAEAAERVSIATPGAPALVRVAPGPQPAASSNAAERAMVIDVVGFKPPPQGSVQVVVTVKAAATGAAKEIGRFGVFPNSEFTAGSGTDPQKFRLNLDEATSRLIDRAGKVSVSLLPRGGPGDGAKLTIGKIDLQPK